MLRWAAAAAVASAVGGGAAVAWERSAYGAELVSVAAQQAADANAASRGLEAEIAKLRAVAQSQAKDLESRVATVDALWDERERRIESETKRAADSIFCAPEGFSVLSGLTAHCEDGAGKLGFFHEAFDLNASKLHTIAMLLAAAARSSLRDVAPALGMFRRDPLISAIALELHADAALAKQGAGRSRSSASDAASSDLPESVSDLSATFRRSMAQFQDAVRSAAREAAAANAASAALSAPSSSSSSSRTQAAGASELDTDGDVPLGFVVGRVAPRIADALRVQTSADVELAQLAARADAQRQRDVVASWALADESDVFAAIEYVTATHASVVRSAAGGATWALQPRVAPAMKNLCVWALAAEQYLAEAQTRRALENIMLCTSHSFVQINEVGDLPGEKE